LKNERAFEYENDLNFNTFRVKFQEK